MSDSFPQQRTTRRRTRGRLQGPPRKRARHIRIFETLEPRLVLDSTVVFSEIMYNPPGADEALEWIELHSQMAVNMDLSEWTIEGGAEFQFPDGTVMPGGGYLIVAKDPAAFTAATGSTEALGPFDG